MGEGIGRRRKRGAIITNRCAYKKKRRKCERSDGSDQEGKSLQCALFFRSATKKTLNKIGEPFDLYLCF